MNKVVAPMVVAVLGALLVAALTPLGDGIRELLFPTRVTVVGTVTIPQTSLTALRVSLDGGEPRQTEAAFRLQDVRAGQHRLELTSAGSQPRIVEFQVAQGGGPEQDLGALELTPLVRMGYFEEPAAPAQVVDYDFTVWLLGEPEPLSRIATVTYALPPPFEPPQVGGAGAAQHFCYRQTGSVAFGQIPPGGNPFTATVQLTDGASFEIGTLSTPLGGLQPPDCPVLAPAPPPTPVPVPTLVPNPNPVPVSTPADPVAHPDPDPGDADGPGPRRGDRG